MAAVDDYFSRSWDHGAPDAEQGLVTQDLAQGYCYTAAPPSETQTPHDSATEHGSAAAHEIIPHRLPIQRSGHISASNPRKFHKRTRSGTKVMLASSATPKKPLRPKHKRRQSGIEPIVQTSKTQGRKDVTPNRPALGSRSKSSSSTLYRRPRGDQNDRIRRHKRTKSPVENRMRSLVSPSLLTVLSTLTGTTGSSTGSNLTIKPSTARPTGHAHRNRVNPRRHPSFRQERSNELEERLKSKSELSASKVDVFDFLDHEASGFNWGSSNGGPFVRFVPQPTKDEQQVVPSDSVPSTDNTRERAISLPGNQEGHRHDGFFSDSGISVGGDSPDMRRSSQDHGYSPFEVKGKDAELDRDIADSPASLPFVDASTAAFFDTAHYPPLARHSMPNYVPAQPFQPFNHDHFHYQPNPMAPRSEMEYSTSSFTTAEPTLAGYELLASKLSAFPAARSEQESLIPLYRRFEKLHNRVLLHLQDEIVELEEQLRDLDEYIGRSQQDLHGAGKPASRREDAQYNDRLRYQRTEILGRICVKLSTYDQALENYRSMVQKTESARPADITKYKNWLDEFQPVADEEESFLDDELDLISISSRARQPRRSARANEGDSQEVIECHSAGFSTTTAQEHEKLRRHLLLGLPAAMLVTFVAFAALSGFWARLIVMLILTSAGCICMHLSELHIHVVQQEVMLGIAFYVLVMTVLASTS